MDKEIIIREAKIPDYKDLGEIIKTSLGYDSSDEMWWSSVFVALDHHIQRENVCRSLFLFRVFALIVLNCAQVPHRGWFNVSLRSTVSRPHNKK